MDLGLKGKVVIVTGGGKGIGGGISKCLAAEGAIPVIVSRSKLDSDFEEEIKALCPNYGFYQLDLSKWQEISAVVEQIVAKYGSIYALVNNAGMNDNLHIESATTQDLIKSYESNLFHYYEMTKCCLPYIKKEQGSILNISSKTGITGQGRTTAYASAKGAQIAMTREWACAFAPDNVRVNCICPAEVWTPLYEKWIKNFPDPEKQYQEIAKFIPLGHRFTTCEEIADTAVFTISPRASHTTGQILTPDGGYMHLDRALNWEN